MNCKLRILKYMKNTVDNSSLQHVSRLTPFYTVSLKFD